MESPILFALNTMTLTIIVFSANLLCLRSFERQAYLPLGVCLMAIGIVISQPTLANIAPAWQSTFLIFSLPAILLIAPCFWFYVCGITSETPWRVRQIAKHHFILSGLGLIIAIAALSLPDDIRYALLVEGDDNILKTVSTPVQYFTYGALIATFLLVLGWILQSGWYFYRVIQRLARYRQQLKDLFASTETKEIRWLSWLLVAVGVVWSATAINIVLDNLIFATQFNAIFAGVIMLIMIWSVATWGLRQKPGFEEIYLSNGDLESVIIEPETTTEKYQRSALSEQQASQIADKITQAMQQDRLYLNASLSLQKLAKHINTSPNYISQTLNETLGMSFFDYVNKYRVEQAKEELKQSDKTVLDIAMNVGFNAKSSFYTAFKKEVHQTPSQYRKEMR